MRGTDWVPILKEYEQHLLAIRQLAEPTVRNYMNDLAGFMSFLSESDQLDKVVSPDPPPTAQLSRLVGEP